MLEATIQGIPCLIEVTEYSVTPPWKGSVAECPSEMDFYGYDEIEYTVRDRRGYLAPWLERKITDEDNEAILALVRESSSVAGVL